MDVDSPDGGASSALDEFDKDAEYNAIRKDARELDENLVALEKKIFADESEYYELSMMGASSCNSLKGWDNFLDVKLDGSIARITKIPEADRFFSGSSEKKTTLQPQVQASVLSAEQFTSGDDTDSRAGSPEPPAPKKAEEESKPVPKKRKRRQ